jgi:hypothetical protein
MRTPWATEILYKPVPLCTGKSQLLQASSRPGHKKLNEKQIDLKARLRIIRNA